MIRYGALALAMGPMSRESMFTPRLKLLIVMAQALEKNYPLGRWRRKAVIENADYIFYETLYRSMELRQQAASGQERRPDGEDRDQDDAYVHFLWLQRIQLMAVMTKSMAQGNPAGQYRMQAFNENLSYIAGRLDEAPDLSRMPFLKVA